jgi:hypothetical protein
MTKRTYDQMSKEEENKKKMVTKKESCLHMRPQKNILSKHDPFRHTSANAELQIMTHRNA